MKDKFVKLSAIEQMAEPMEKIHEDEGYEEKDHSKCVCPCCGEPCPSCEEDDEEMSDEYEEDEEVD